MPQEYLLLIVLVISVTVGYLLGKYIAVLGKKSELSNIQSEVSSLTERLEAQKANQVVAEAKLEKQLVDFKAESASKEKALIEEKEIIRKEKDFLNAELSRRNADFENLQQRNSEQKEEVSKLQEKFTKEFEKELNHPCIFKTADRRFARP